MHFLASKLSPGHLRASLSWERATGLLTRYWHHARWRQYQDAEEAYATYHPDHQVLAYHHEAIEELWPFDLSWDSRCWWTSQWHQSALTGLATPSVLGVHIGAGAD